jgi:hypothetical protein
MYLLTAFRAFAPFLSYSLNKAYIIKEYCINKSKPDLHCDGKCYLKQQEVKEAQQEKKAASSPLNGEQHVSPHLAEERISVLHSGIESLRILLLFSAHIFSSSFDIPTPPPKA